VFLSSWLHAVAVVGFFFKTTTVTEVVTKINYITVSFHPLQFSRNLPTSDKNIKAAAQARRMRMEGVISKGDLDAPTEYRGASSERRRLWLLRKLPRRRNVHLSKFICQVLDNELQLGRLSCCS